MRRCNRILIAELIGVIVAIFAGAIVFTGGALLLDGIDILSDQIVATTAQGDVGDVEGYGALLDLMGITFGGVGMIALLMLAFVECALAIGSLLFTIIARVSYRPGKKGRYAVLTALALAPLGLLAIVSLMFAFGEGVSGLWLATALIEAAVVVYSIFETARMLGDGANVDPGGAYGDGAYVPPPEEAR